MSQQMTPQKLVQDFKEQQQVLSERLEALNKQEKGKPKAMEMQRKELTEMIQGYNQLIKDAQDFQSAPIQPNYQKLVNDMRVQHNKMVAKVLDAGGNKLTEDAERQATLMLEKDMKALGKDTKNIEVLPNKQALAFKEQEQGRKKAENAARKAQGLPPEKAQQKKAQPKMKGQRKGGRADNDEHDIGDIADALPDNMKKALQQFRSGEAVAGNEQGNGEPLAPNAPSVNRGPRTIG